MVRLVPMTQAQFERYMEGAVDSYAQAHLKSGDCDASDARQLAQADYDKLLPDGLASPGDHLFSICLTQTGDPIGMIWFEIRQDRGKTSAYIFDFQIDEAQRGKGHGAAALRAAEALASSMGAARISLNVMGWNDNARRLYERAGFSVTGIGMTKLITSS